jgi:hypothetical protein
MAGPERPRPISATIIPYNTRPATGAVEIQKQLAIGELGQASPLAAYIARKTVTGMG